MPLYHREIGFPSDFRPPSGQFALRYTGHAEREARRDRYGDLTELLPAYLDTRQAQLVEVEYRGGAAAKLLYRLPTRTTLDLVVACEPERHAWVVKTVWANERADTHKTLNRRKYDSPRAVARPDRRLAAYL